MKQTNGYPIFLIIQLSIAKGLIKNDVEYDLMWETGEAMYNDFLKSEFNVDNQSEYDCITNYLNNLSFDDVVFLWEDCIDSDVFAYFPNTTFDSKGNKASYSHIGQHSACSEEYAKGCKLATPNEYNDLKNELEGLHYRLIILTEFAN